MYTYIYIYIWMFIFMYIHTYTYICIYMYTYAHTHTHTHTHAHTNSKRVLTLAPNLAQMRLKLGTELSEAVTACTDALKWSPDNVKALFRRAQVWIHTKKTSTFSFSLSRPGSVALTRDPGPGTRNPKPNLQNPKPKPQNPKPKTKNPDPTPQTPNPKPLSRQSTRWATSRPHWPTSIWSLPTFPLLSQVHMLSLQYTFVIFGAVQLPYIEGGLDLLPSHFLPLSRFKLTDLYRTLSMSTYE